MPTHRRLKMDGLLNLPTRRVLEVVSHSHRQNHNASLSVNLLYRCACVGSGPEAEQSATSVVFWFVFFLLVGRRLGGLRGTYYDCVATLC